MVRAGKSNNNLFWFFIEIVCERLKLNQKFFLVAGVKFLEKSKHFSFAARKGKMRGGIEVLIPNTSSAESWYKRRIEEGIQNWAKATIGIDDSFSDDTKKITDEKLYEIITSDKEREKIKQQREEFYKDSKIQTDNITVEIKKASEALYNERTIGYVEAKVTVEGKRNDDSFTNKYDLVLLMDYQEDVASVYEVVDIKTE